MSDKNRTKNHGSNTEITSQNVEFRCRALYLFCTGGSYEKAWKVSACPATKSMTNWAHPKARFDCPTHCKGHTISSVAIMSITISWSFFSDLFDGHFIGGSLHELLVRRHPLQLLVLFQKRPNSVWGAQTPRVSRSVNPFKSVWEQDTATMKIIFSARSWVHANPSLLIFNLNLAGTQIARTVQH